MKRIVTALIVVLTICVMLSGCSKSGKPKDMDEETYEAGKRAVEIVQDFLDAKITVQEAYDKLGIIHDRLDGLEFDGKNQSIAKSKNLSIEAKITSLSVFLLNHKISNGSLKYISENLKELKDYLGLK